MTRQRRDAAGGGGPITKRFLYAGETVELRCDEQRLVGLVKTLCEPIRGGAASITLDFSVVQAPQKLPKFLFEEWSVDLPVFTVSIHDVLRATVDVRARKVSAQVAAALFEGAPETVLRLAVEAPLAAVLAANGWCAVHGAAVVGSAGAVVVRGAPDAGKSTLAAAAWRDGLEVLGDESVLVNRDDATHLAASVREVLLAPEMATELGIEGEAARTTAGEHKVRLPLGPLQPPERCARHLATVLLGRRDAPAGAELRGLSGHELVDRFGEAAIDQESWHSGTGQVVRAWSERPLFELRGASDLDGAVRLLGELCGGRAI